MSPIHQNYPQNKNNYYLSVLFYTAVKQIFGKLSLLFLVLLSNLVIGQSLPTAVDNSKWFPPAGTQHWNSCHVYAMTYLKDYCWNRQYNRDPKLAQNQFSPYFIWNLEISPLGHWMESYSDFNFMQQQGCATMNDFSSQGESQEIVPSLLSREKALSYKSKSLIAKHVDMHTEAQAEVYLNDLKKSLNSGICFTLHFPLFKSIENLYNEGESVYSYENNKIADMYNSHVAVVVGYDDNIVTKSGKGALKLLNSWGEVFGDNGYFYLDYNFFKIPDWSFNCYFLEEDFNHVTDLYLSLNLSQAITGDNIANKDYIFTDGVESLDGKNYDFADNTYYDYSHGRNLVKVRSINKQKNANFDKIIYIASHNHDGNHQIVADLTDYIKSTDFQSMEVVIQDPISSSYVGSNGNVIYSYTRQAKVGVADTHIKFMNNGKLITGKVQDLPDTTIVVNNFYSRLVGAHLTPQAWQEVYVQSCTSVLKRKLITFSIDGQSLPTAVDNSIWFPPVRSQEAIPNCTQFSLIYYLKSSIWNKQLGRDPKLEVNQFNHNFVWNQIINPVYEKSNAEVGFYFMKEQGCATMADFPANEQSSSIQPSVDVKIKALSFKSKRLFKTDFASCGGNYQNLNQRLISLKDSLSHGKCFTINIMLFDSFFKMSATHNVYSCYGAVSLDSIKPSHVVTVVGYDDNIKTAKGTGAFKVIDSNADLTQGVFYFDYNWLYLTSSDYTCYFLEEDFSSQPKIVTCIQLSGAISGKDAGDVKYPFVETLVTSLGKIVDFNDYTYYLINQNQVQVVGINGTKLPLRSKIIVKHRNNLDGNYELISDLSDLSSVSNFKSASVVIFDPISANYVGADGQSFYSYAKTATVNVEKAYLYFIDTDKKITATVKNLSDTTIVANGFYTNIVKPVGNNDPWIYVKSCTSVLKRKLITFSIDGQSLPTAVDNSKWFPPVRSQEALQNCTHFSLIYYLKSSIWNKKLNRDPKLEVNQFNHNFVWNQNVDPTYKKSDSERAFYFMKEQGCATIADFPFNESATYVQPDINTKEKALAYKSKRLFRNDFFGNDKVDRSDAYVSQKIKSLKDSLSQGKCFTLGIQLFRYFEKMTNKNNVYSCYQGIRSDSVFYGHAFTIVGYNDTIKTAQGRGAFQVINSYAEPAGGHIYLDYNWFYFAKWQTYEYCFLEEDFSSQPKIVADIQLSGAISGQDVSTVKYPFVETLITSSGRIVDFDDYIHYLGNQNQVQVVGINGTKLPLRSKIIVKPRNNLDGNYELISDLSDLSSVSNFKSASVVIFDPISANYVGADGQSFYSYAKTATVNVEKAYLYFIDTDKKIIATVKNLSDTTIVANSFYTNIVKPAGNTDPWIYVQSCTSVLKRKLITFSIDGAEVNSPPVFTQVPSSETTVTRGDVVNLQVTARDPEGKALIYSVVNGNGTIDQTGKFTYSATQSGTFSFAVKVSDGVNDIIASFNVKVLDPVVETLAFTKVPGSEVIIAQEELYSFQFAATGPKDRTLTFSLIGIPDGWSFLKTTFNEKTGEFSFWCDGTHLTSLPLTVKVSDGVNSVSTDFKVTVKEKANTPPTFINVPGVLTTSKNVTLTHQFEAVDQEKNPLIFSILNPIPEATISMNGLMTFKSATAGTFNFTVVVNDGHVSVSQDVTVKVGAISVNTAPVFVNLPAVLSAYVNKDFSYQFEASDKENDHLTFSLLYQISGVNITSGGLLTFKYAKVGTYMFTVVVSDGKLTDSANVTVVVNFNVGAEDIPESDYSVKVYPNPFNTSTAIKFTTQKKQQLTLSIFDSKGRQIAVVANGEYEAGEQIFAINANDLPDGIYLGILHTPEGLKTIKFVKHSF